MATDTALAQEATEGAGPASDGPEAATSRAAPAETQPPGFWSRTGTGVKNIWTGGGSDLFIPGYIWHTPYRYSEEQINRYNTAAWGLGYGRTLRSSPNRPSTLYAIVSADSYDKPQYMVGYAWRARWRPTGGAFSFGGGYTAFLTGREDKGKYVPIPFAAALGSVGVDRFELMGAYVPLFDVGYFFLRINFGGGRAQARK
jgi:Antimicrobial peptide resistance and lipid A acylation protein PagP